MTVQWIKPEVGWFDLSTLNLQHEHFNNLEGVYVIADLNTQRIIRLGQGVIADRLQKHRVDPQITKYQQLVTTWAWTPAQFRDGIERYLATELRPVIGDAFPNTNPIPVNLP